MDSETLKTVIGIVPGMCPERTVPELWKALKEEG